jgi:KUP system potassium uptake protein
LGLLSVLKTPSILQAINPYWAFSYIRDHGWQTTMTLGSVVLAVTGAEALYADMGHFGRSAINRAWHVFALPGLLLNYLGQGAVAIRDPLSHDNPFFALVPPGAGNIALVILATAATIIASQAMISGVYSITQQAIQLGFFPRMEIRHTSETAFGQIYVPTINWMLGLSCILVVIQFGTSERLAAAYGIAVTGTMAITSVAFGQVMRKHWNRPAWQAYGLMAVMLAVDLPLFFSNLHKIEDGGAFPLIVASLLLVVMHTWKVGRAAIAKELSRQGIDMETFVKDVEESKPHRVRGTAIFMTGRSDGVPATLLHHFKHHQVLHHNVILLTFVTDSVPRLTNKDRVELEELGQGFWRASAHYGFMEEPRIIGAMDLINEASDGKLSFNPQRASYVFNREVIIGSGRSELWGWQKALLGFLTRNARQARDYFNVPTNQIVELATPIKL